jgi:thioredoxin reductase (NADPH)
MDLFKPMDISGDDKKDNKPEKEPEKVRCLIIGSGPAGYTAAIYAARANLKPVLYEGIEPGGQLTTTTEVENFPGYPDGVSGPQMMEDLKKQAVRFGTDSRYGIAVEVDLSAAPYKTVIDNGDVIKSDTLIIATGATARYLGLESEKTFMGSGVSACATCDGFFYKGQDVAVVGGGDSACEEALYLAGLCNKVYMIVRKNYMRASKILQERITKKNNIEVLHERNTKELRGKDTLEEAVLIYKMGQPDEAEETIKISGFFLAIGHTPNSQIFKDYLETDDNGYIKTIPGTAKTSIPGIFACGDIQDPTYRQAVTAAGSGCQAAIDAERYLSGIGL